MLLNCGVGEDSWESLGLQGDQTKSILKEINPEYSLEGRMMNLKLQDYNHLKRWLIGKDPDTGKDWRQEEKRATENEMVGWHHWFSGHGLGKTPGDGEGSGKPGALQYMGSQRVGYNPVTERQQPVTNHAKHLFTCLQHFFIFFGEMSVQISGTFFSWVVFLVLSHKSSLHTPNTMLVPGVWFVNTVSHALGCLFTVWTVYVDAQKLLILMKSNLSIFFFCCLCSDVVSKKLLPNPRS